MHRRPCLINGGLALSEKPVGLEERLETGRPRVRGVQVSEVLGDGVSSINLSPTNLRRISLENEYL